MTFLDLGAHPTLRAALEARNYTQPTPVQAAVLAPANAGRDLVVSAETGSGKTIAFGLALAPELLGERERMEPIKSPAVLILAPTRELALQVQRELAWLYADAGLRSVACVGGMEMFRQLRALSDGVHLVVGTPGRVVDHLNRKSLSLANLKALVLDEADEMLDMGFREELETVLESAPKERRTLMFSATIAPEILALSKHFLNNPQRITATPVAEAHRDIAYRAHRIAYREREHAVVNVLRAHDGPAIVFGQTRDSVHHLEASLTERGFSCVALSGELSQVERNRALGALRDGRARVLVATDVAARGIDLPDVTMVIQADLPQNADALKHRAGRTGRAGRKGIAVVLVPVDRRFTAERHFREAHITPSWEPVPSAADIRKRDRAKLVELLAQPAEVSDEDLAVADELLALGEARKLVAQLVAQTRGQFPEPEDLPLTEALDRESPVRQPRAVRRAEQRGGAPGAPFDRGAPYERNAPPYARNDGPPRGDRYERGAPSYERNDGPPRARPDAPPSPRGDGPPRPYGDAPQGHYDDEGASTRTRGRRPSFPGEGPSAWFSLDVGYPKADPRWIVPMLCRRGGVNREDIGAITVLENETRVEIRPSVAARFAARAGRPDRIDGHVTIAPATAPPARRPPPRDL